MISDQPTGTAIRIAPIQLTSESFEDSVLHRSRPILVQFWAPWCVPCMLMKKTVQRVAEELQGDVTVGLINIDEEPELVRRLGAQGTPTFMLFENGKMIDSFAGMATKSGLVRRVLSHVAKSHA